MLINGFKDELQAARSQQNAQIEALDPTQKLLVEVVGEWAGTRKAWKARLCQPTMPPKLRLLLLGTAGTGKTHTAKIAITEVRTILGLYESVLTMDFTGVASVNLGTGARTIDSIFHTNRDAASEDLTGEDLDKLVDELRSVEMVVIDEISTCSASTLEVVSRRMQQVARVLWRGVSTHRLQMISGLLVALACS